MLVRRRRLAQASAQLLRSHPQRLQQHPLRRLFSIDLKGARFHISRVEAKHKFAERHQSGDSRLAVDVKPNWISRVRPVYAPVYLFDVKISNRTASVKGGKTTTTTRYNPFTKQWERRTSTEWFDLGSSVQYGERASLPAHETAVYAAYRYPRADMEKVLNNAPLPIEKFSQEMLQLQPEVRSSSNWLCALPCLFTVISGV